MKKTICALLAVLLANVAVGSVFAAPKTLIHPMAGVDVSEWNGEIDFGGLKQAGAQFVMIRAGSGRKGTVDRRFHENMANAKKAGLKVGVYFQHNVGSADDAVRAAWFLLDTISGYELDFPVALDYEYETGNDDYGIEEYSKSHLSEIADAFLGEVEREGYIPMIYASKYILQQRLLPETLEKYAVWLAHYADETDFAGHSIWQHSKTGTIGGKLFDLNICYSDFS
ncbi:MAG: hypothetical protein LBC69_00250 [Eubacteriaceae bacterium]|jgi:GH25 family lysozyme M1 (1,4-beta-N-acetylmuramidase)|nr:hypothetical protein [Eubacteriaceae bacterium]